MIAMVAAIAAQSVLSRPALAQRSGSGSASASIRGDWLQANDLPFTRQAAPSVSAALEFRHPAWSIDVGWLRAARNLSTVQGGFVGISRPIHLRSVVLLPGIAGFAGVANVSRDTTGYDYLTPGSTAPLKGHVPRYDYSRAATFGGGVTLALEIPVVSVIGLRASGSQWYFSGTPMTGDRARTLAGVGLVIHFNLATRSAFAPAKKMIGAGEDK